MNKRTLNTKGFTILELLIATTVFSVMLLLVSGAIIQLSRQFYKGLVKSKTQEVARNISEEIINNIQFSSSVPTSLGTNGDVEGWCIADRRYAFVRHKQLGTGPGQTEAVLLRSGSCDALPATLTPTPGSTELIGDNMRLAVLNIESDGSGKVWQVTVKVVHGDDDIVKDPTTEGAACVSEMASSQYCATAEYTATIVRRL